MLTVAGCKLGQNLLRDQADPSAIGGLSSAEFLTTSCVFRSLEFRDFLKKALDKNPETRPSAAQLLEVGTRAVSPGWFQIISVLFRKFFSEEKSAFQHFSATEMLQKGSAMFGFFSPLERPAESSGTEEQEQLLLPANAHVQPAWAVPGQP